MNLRAVIDLLCPVSRSRVIIIGFAEIKGQFGAYDVGAYGSQVSVLSLCAPSEATGGNMRPSMEENLGRIRDCLTSSKEVGLIFLPEGTEAFARFYGLSAQKTLLRVLSDSVTSGAKIAIAAENLLEKRRLLSAFVTRWMHGRHTIWGYDRLLRKHGLSTCHKFAVFPALDDARSFIALDRVAARYHFRRSLLSNETVGVLSRLVRSIATWLSLQRYFQSRYLFVATRC